MEGSPPLSRRCRSARRWRSGHEACVLQPLLHARRLSRPSICVTARAGSPARPYHGRQEQRAAASSTWRRAPTGFCVDPLPLLQESRCRCIFGEPDTAFGALPHGLLQVALFSCRGKWHKRALPRGEACPPSLVSTALVPPRGQSARQEKDGKIRGRSTSFQPIIGRQPIIDLG